MCVRLSVSKSGGWGGARPKTVGRSRRSDQSKGPRGSQAQHFEQIFRIFLFAQFVCSFFEARDIHTLKCLPTKTAQGYDLLILKT